MIPTLSIKGYQCVVSAYTTQGRQLHLISLVGVRESVRAVLAAMQSHNSAVLKAEETTLVSLGYQNIKVIQSRLPSGMFQAIAIGEAVSCNDILVLKPGMTLAERFYRALLDKTTLPLHSSWQGKLLEIAQQGKLLTPLTSHGIEAYALDLGIGDFETQVRRALIQGELPQIGEPLCV